MKDAYLKYKLGPEAVNAKEFFAKEEMTKALGFAPDNVPDNYARAMEEFEEWYSRFVTEKKN